MAIWGSPLALTILVVAALGRDPELVPGAFLVLLFPQLWMPVAMSFRPIGSEPLLPLVVVSLFTTTITSIWLWLYILAVLASRVLLRVRHPAVGSIGRVCQPCIPIASLKPVVFSYFRG